jgi:O-antigen ligase
VPVSSTADTPKKAQAVFDDLRVLLVGAVLAAGVFAPAFALRSGAIVCSAVLLTCLHRIRFEAPEVLAVLYGVLAVLSTTWSVAPAQSGLGATNTLAVVVLFVTARTVMRRLRDLRIMSLGLLFGCAVGLVQLWLDNPYLAVRLEFDVRADRVGIEGLNYNYLAYAFATGAGALLLLWVAAQRSQSRAWAAPAALAVAALLYLGVILNGSRGALLAVILLFAWWLIARINPRRMLRAVVLLVLTLNLMVLTGVADDAVRARTARSVRETGDLNGRLAIWPVARDYLWERPFAGYGVDAFSGLSRNPLPIPAHNALLDIGVGMGLLGVALFVGIVWSALGRGARDSDNPQKAVLLGAFIAISAPITLTGYWIESPVFWMSLALFSRLSLLNKGQELGSDVGVHNQMRPLLIGNNGPIRY